MYLQEIDNVEPYCWPKALSCTRRWVSLANSEVIMVYIQALGRHCCSNPPYTEVRTRSSL